MLFVFELISTPYHRVSSACKVISTQQTIGKMLLPCFFPNSTCTCKNRYGYMLSISIRFIKHFGEVHLVGEVWYAYLIEENKSFWYNKDWWKFGLTLPGTIFSTRDSFHDKLYEVCILGTSSCRLTLNIGICPLMCQFWDFVRSTWSILSSCMFFHLCRFEYNLKF